ncbi:MAG: PDZ domain-containing protein [Verrucomicrobia bacterium]|nr:PDZ domain-containing protein [Verrucomicrobiota bacterium]
MKISQVPLLAGGLAAILATPLPAIEPPADQAPPPPVAAAPAAPGGQAVVPAPANAQLAPYLGIGSSHVPEVLAAHLGLKTDEGIVIRALDPEGPGAKAGLAEHDVITRVGGQAVGSHADLVKQIQSHRPGDEISLDLIHQGKPATKAITLAARPDGGGLAAAPPELDNLMLDGMPQEQAKRIQEAIDRQLRGMQGGAAIPGAVPQMNEAMKELQKRMAEAMKNGMPRPGGGLKVQGSAVFRMVDETGSIEMKSVDGGKEATVRDKDHKITWTGPWDTAQDKAAAPPAIRARIEKLNLDDNFNGNGLRLQFGGDGLIQPEAEPEVEAAPEVELQMENRFRQVPDRGPVQPALEPDAEQPEPPAPKGAPIE